MATAEPPRYRLPLWALRRAPWVGFTIAEAKSLAQDIRLWLIGQGYEIRDELEEP